MGVVVNSLGIRSGTGSGLMVDPHIDALVAAGQPVRAGTVRAEVDEAAAERRTGEDPSGTS